jgi:hypothetical protein
LRLRLLSGTARKVDYIGVTCDARHDQQRGLVVCHSNAGPGPAPGTSQAAGARLSERGITKCHVRLKFLTWILMVTAQWVSYIEVDITNAIGELPMTNLKTLSAIAILTAAIATPVFAQPAHHSRTLDRYRGAYNQVTGPSYATQRSGRNLEDVQFDRSFPGGENPDNNPPGN